MECLNESCYLKLEMFLGIATVSKIMILITPNHLVHLHFLTPQTIVAKTGTKTSNALQAKYFE